MKEVFQDTITYARALDLNDPLRDFRDKFHIPKHGDGKDLIYFCGNSLGLQPKGVREDLNEVLDSWKERGVEGHFMGNHPWMHYHEELAPTMAHIVGAMPHEISIMNTLTANLHFMMASFYRPNKERFKILIDYSPFPSDRYVVNSQIDFHGFDPKEALIEVKPKKGSEIVSLEDIEKVLEESGHEIALVMMAGINYYTGQLYPIREITRLARKKGCKVGFDLAHAAGNVNLNLHEDGPDFAAWCTYKYMNSGPGNLSGCFVHDRHKMNLSLPRFAGWWGYEKETRFLMKDEFVPISGAEGWTVSNPPILSMAGIKTSMRIFSDAGIDRIVAKSKKLTGYLEFLINNLSNKDINIITPIDPNERGCQLSLQVKNANKQLFNDLRAQGVLGDWREPDVIRISPVPLYNSFEEVYTFSKILKKILSS